jgi:hypothetical protein
MQEDSKKTEDLNSTLKSLNRVSTTKVCPATA